MGRPAILQPHFTTASLLLHALVPPTAATMSSKEPQPNEAEKNIEIWKVKKLIKRLEAARGNGTSMISLIIRTAASLAPAPSRHEPRTDLPSAQGPDLARGQDAG